MGNDYRELRSRLGIEDVLSWMSWRASSRVGNQLRGSCPLCTATPDPASRSSSQGSPGTFSVHTQRHIYQCFRCHSSGNALDLWSVYRELPIYEAAQEIESRIGGNEQSQRFQN